MDYLVLDKINVSRYYLGHIMTYWSKSCYISLVLIANLIITRLCANTIPNYSVVGRSKR